jgi:hypothetical protein
MGTAASAMENVSQLLSGQLRADLQSITEQLNSSSTRLATVDLKLAGTSESLDHAATEMQKAADAIADGALSRRWFPFAGKRH